MDLEQILKASKLPASIGAVEKLEQYMELRQKSLEDIVQVVANDPVLARKIMKAANCPVLSGGGITDVKEAVFLIGVDELFTMVAAAEIVRTFKEMAIGWESPGKIWNENAFSAAAAMVMARHIAFPENRLYICGLLRGVGHLLMFAAIPKVVAKIFEGVRKGMGQYHEIERELLGFDHAELAAELLRRWHLPETIYEPIRHYLQPGKTRPYYIEAALLSLANYAMHEHFSLPRPPLYDTLLTSKTGNSDQAFIARCRSEINSTHRKTANWILST